MCAAIGALQVGPLGALGQGEGGASALRGAVAVGEVQAWGEVGAGMPRRHQSCYIAAAARVLTEDAHFLHAMHMVARRARARAARRRRMNFTEPASAADAVALALGELASARTSDGVKHLDLQPLRSALGRVAPRFVDGRAGCAIDVLQAIFALPSCVELADVVDLTVQTRVRCRMCVGEPSVVAGRSLRAESVLYVGATRGDGAASAGAEMTRCETRCTGQLAQCGRGSCTSQLWERPEVICANERRLPTAFRSSVKSRSSSFES